MLLMLPLTPLVCLYGWSPGSSLGGPDASARLPPIAMTAVSAEHTVFIMLFVSFCSVGAMLTRPRFDYIKGVLQKCYGLSLKRGTTPPALSVAGPSGLPAGE